MLARRGAERVRRSVTAALGAAALLAAAPFGVAGAQQTGRDTVPPDSAFLAEAEEVLAWLDSMAVLDSLALHGAAPATRHVLSLGTMRRDYDVGGVAVAETSAPLRWSWRGDRLALRATGAPVSYDAIGAAVSGTVPFTARADVMLRPGDTLSVYGRTASSPGALDSTALTSLAAVGTSTLDLASVGFGVPALVGARALFSFPVGDVVLGLGAGVEVEPTPGGAETVFWRGTTVRAEASLYGYVGDGSWRLGLEYARSNADSLGGRNLFPGGGQVVLDGRLDGPVFGGQTWGTLGGFYLRAVDLDVAAQPNRLIPVGDLVGTYGSLYVPVGRLALLPTVSLLRESSTATATDGRVATRIDGSGWSFTAGTALDVPLGGGLTLTPEAGLVRGTIGGQFAQALVRAPRLARGATFDDPVSGWYAGLSLGIRF
jgi:hypothetical protein